MSKAVEYNDKVIKKEHNKVNKLIDQYYHNKCNYNELNEENKKLLEKYINLEKLIDSELNKIK